MFYTSVAFSGSSGAWSSGHVGPETQFSAPLARANLRKYETAVLTNQNHILSSMLSELADVDAVFSAKDADNILMVFVVVPEHTDEIYDQIIEIEEKIIDALRDDTIELRIRAHQGRMPVLAVPLNSEPIFIR